MSHFEIIQHPLDMFSLTGSMTDLDARGRDSADQLLTMIGDLQFFKEDVRGTCARYLLFIENEWFCKLCSAARIDSGKLRNYLLCFDMEATDKSQDTCDDPQASFCFPENENQSARAITSATATQSETRPANNGENEDKMVRSGPSLQKPAPKRINNLEKKRLG
jgi:hypothetical protein